MLFGNAWANIRFRFLTRPFFSACNKCPNPPKPGSESSSKPRKRNNLAPDLLEKTHTVFTFPPNLPSTPESFSWQASATETPPSWQQQGFGQQFESTLPILSNGTRGKQKQSRPGNRGDLYDWMYSPQGCSPEEPNLTSATKYP